LGGVVVPRRCTDTVVVVIGGDGIRTRRRGLITVVGDSLTDYFSLGKPAVVEEERFRSLTELKWGEFEAMGFGGLDLAEKKLQFDLTESARTVRLNLSSVMLQMFMYRVAVASSKTNDAHLDGLLVHWIHSHRRATERDPTVQHQLPLLMDPLRCRTCPSKPELLRG